MSSVAGSRSTDGASKPGQALIEGLPKGRRRRVTMFPDVTPAGVDLSQMVGRRLEEVESGGLVFPAPQGGLQRRSNYGRYLWDRAAEEVGWPKQHGGRWLWTFHSLRHVFATWALHDARIPIEDLSRLMGHSTTRVTQDIYIHVRDDMFDRFFDATSQPDRAGESDSPREHPGMLGARNRVEVAGRMRGCP